MRLPVLLAPALLAVTSLLAQTPQAVPQAAPVPDVPEVPGQRADGSVLLPNQWILRPVGKQVVVGDFPVNIAVHPSGKWAAVLHCGYGPHDIVVLDLGSGKVASRVNVNEAFYGLTFWANGKKLMCSGSSDEVLHGFAFDAETGDLGQHEARQLRERKARGIPAGIAIDEGRGMVYVANVWGQSVTRLSPGVKDEPVVTDLSLFSEKETGVTKPGEAAVQAPLPGRVGILPGTAGVQKRAIPDSSAPSTTGGVRSPGQGVAVPPTGAAPLLGVPLSTDDPSITKRASVLLEKATGDQPFPYAVLLDEAKERLYVSLWGQAAVAVIETKGFTVLARWNVEEHPNEMLLSKDGAHLFVANANRNTVSVLETATGTMVETLVAELPPGGGANGGVAPGLPGNTPNSLALSPDEKRLFVANANINMVAVFDVGEVGQSRSLGFIPVGWYPTSVRVTPDGKTLLVANGKGQTSKANRNGPQPGRAELPGKLADYIGGLMDGTVSIIALPEGEKFEKQMKAWTARAFQCVPETARKIDLAALEGNPIPRTVPSPGNVGVPPAAPGTLPAAAAVEKAPGCRLAHALNAR